MERIIVDGDGAVFGRMASFVAKELLKGNYVDVINSEKVIVSGSKNVIVEKIRAKRRMGSGGSMKGPKYIRKEDLLLKRMIRGMLPRDRARGREAFKRLKCHIGLGDFEKDKLEKIITIPDKKPMKYSTIKEITIALK